MHFAMVSPTQGDSEFVADLTSKRRGLRKAQVVSIGRTTAAHQTRFFGNCLDVVTVANAPRRWQTQHGFDDGGALPLSASDLQVMALHPHSLALRAAPGRHSRCNRHRLEVKYSLRRALEDPTLPLAPRSLGRLIQLPIGRAMHPMRPSQAGAWNLANCFAG